MMKYGNGNYTLLHSENFILFILSTINIHLCQGVPHQVAVVEEVALVEEEVEAWAQHLQIPMKIHTKWQHDENAMFTIRNMIGNGNSYSTLSLIIH